jgi:hypothetical protein
MVLKSRFRFWAFLIVGSLAVVSSVLLLFFISLFADVKANVSIMALLGAGLLAFTWLWLFLGELRTKAVFVKIEDGVIGLKRYMGLVPSGVYKVKEFDGYTTCLLPSRSGNYEYLYLMKEGKKRIKLSQFYHSNYSELKRFIIKEVQFLGQEDFSYSREVKEIFEF